MKQPCVYLLASRRNGTLYVGVTSDLVKRLWRHRRGVLEGFTKSYGVHTLVWYEPHANMGSAIAREKAIKGWKRAWKVELIERENPRWLDLYDRVAGPELPPTIRTTAAGIGRGALDSGLRRNDDDRLSQHGGAVSPASAAALSARTDPVHGTPGPGFRRDDVNSNETVTVSEALKVVITDFLTDSLEPERRVLGDRAVVVALDARSEEDLWGRVEDADALIVYHCMTIGRATLDRLARCRLIVRGGVGVDNVDHAYARTRGIAVANVPDYGSEEVADSAIGMMLSLTRGISFLASRLRGDEEAEWAPSHVKPLRRLRGRRFGIVGLGRIGTAAALRAKAFGLDVVFHDPYKLDGYDKALGIRRAESLEALLEQADMLSLHCPLTEETHHLVDARAIDRMPMGSYLVNTARGAVVDTAAIPAAIESGRLAGAGIDVLEREPPLDDPLVRAWRDPSHPAHHRVILNPHAAFYSEEGLMDSRVKSAEACRRLAEGLPLRNVVNHA